MGRKTCPEYEGHEHLSWTGVLAHVATVAFRLVGWKGHENLAVVGAEGCWVLGNAMLMRSVVMFL